MIEGKVLSVRAKGKKGEIITLCIYDEDERKYTVSEGTYRSIGCPLSGDVIDKEAISLLEKEDGERGALSKALKILSFGDNSERRLFAKLLSAKIPKEYARFAVEECVRLGYLDEKRQIERAVFLLSEELLGPKKIAARLATRGYGAKQIRLAISNAIESGRLDINKNKRLLIEKKLGDCADSESRRALLYKFGY